MKTEFGVGVAVLAALAVEGKDFSRAELDAMLDKLAAIPEPNVRRGPRAMCYKMGLPEPRKVVYKCKKCGFETRYMSGRLDEQLAYFRDAAIRLRGMGLAIELDETSLCHVCTPGARMPRTARMARDIETRRCKIVTGEEVKVLSCQYGHCDIVPAEAKDVMGTMAANAVSNGFVVADNAYAVIQRANSTSEVFELIRGERVEVMKSSPCDDKGKLYVRIPDLSERVQRHVPQDALTDFGYGDGSWAFDDRLSKLAWIINGRRVVVQHNDYKLLKSLLAGELVYKHGHRDEIETPLKRELRRLRELLGEPAK